MPTSGPSANALSYSTRAWRPSFVDMIRSQPIEHDAQLSRTAARSSSASVVVSVPKLRPGRAESALKVSRLDSVPRSRYFAVAGPNDRARRSCAAASTASASATGQRVGRAHGDGLELLGAEHGAETAATGVTAVVRDGRVAHEPLAGGADRGDAIRGPEPLAKALLGLCRGQAPEVGRIDDAGAVAVDDRGGRRVARAADHDRVVAGELPGDGEVARCERIVQAVGQRRLRDDGELRARRQRRADERREDEGQRRLGRERLDPGRGQLVQEVRAEARHRRSSRAARHRTAAGPSCCCRRGRRSAPCRNSPPAPWIHCIDGALSLRRPRPSAPPRRPRRAARAGRARPGRRSARRARARRA